MPRTVIVKNSVISGNYSCVRAL